LVSRRLVSVTFISSLAFGTIAKAEKAGHADVGWLGNDVIVAALDTGNFNER